MSSTHTKIHSPLLYGVEAEILKIDISLNLDTSTCSVNLGLSGPLEVLDPMWSRAPGQLVEVVLVLLVAIWLSTSVLENDVPLNLSIDRNEKGIKVMKVILF